MQEHGSEARRGRDGTTLVLTDRVEEAAKVVMTVRRRGGGRFRSLREVDQLIFGSVQQRADASRMDVVILQRGREEVDIDTLSIPKGSSVFSNFKIFDL